LGIDGRRTNKEGAGLKKSLRIFSFSVVHLNFPQAQRRGADGAKRRLDTRTVRGFSPGAWGSPQQAASVREWNPGRLPCLLT